tara:strand:- start:2959 stop:3750 length:792 start_codon:yes stop_codon:yes gene_type:complete
MLLTRDVIKCAFFHSEEIGCVGSRQADMNWFKNVGYCFQGDRRGNSDFVNNISGKLFSKAFTKKIKPILAHHGYKITSGAITDVGQLAENGIGVCVANMSCGYYNPHSDQEYVVFNDANNCLTMVERLIDDLGFNKYEFQYTSDYGNYDWGDWSGANRSYWYADHNNLEKEVIADDLGNYKCYYCHCENLLESEFGIDYRYCPDCLSDIYVGDDEITDPNQIEIEYDDYDDEYEDVSDNYDGSMKHKEVVNRYLTDHWSKKNK